MVMFKINRLLLILSAIFFSGVLWAAEVPAVAAKADPENLATPVATQTPTENGSTLSPYNHAVYQFNDILDRAILKPVAKLYNKLVPRPLHQGISNFFSNIDNIPTVVNDVLQLRLYHTLNDSWRLLVNSTVGILGIFDVATRIGLKSHHEDFGLTLARWGYKHSNYFIVPFFGPGTIRDVIGWPVDYFFFSIYPYISDTNVRYGMYAVGVVDRRSNLLQYQDVLEQVAVDKYAFMRTAYLQHRQHQIEENEKSGDSASQEAESSEPEAS